MIVSMAGTFGPHLQGKLPGKRHFAKLCDVLSSVPPGTVVFLDFKGVEVVTGSWVNALFVPFFQWARAEDTDLFPVICNLAVKEWLDEFALVAEWTHRCFLVAHGPLPAKSSKSGLPAGPRPKGHVERRDRVRAGHGSRVGTPVDGGSHQSDGLE